MQKAYSRTNWENYPSDKTPLNETNLNKMDRGLDEIDDRVLALDTNKATKEEVAALVQSVEFEENTGVFKITKKNGSVLRIDTKMEKIAVNFLYDKNTQQIILTLIDGTKQYINLSALITQFEFVDTGTIGFDITPDGKVKATVLDGSITENKLQPNYLADVKVEVAKADKSREKAAESEKNAKASEVAAFNYANEWKGSLLPQGNILFANIPTSGMVKGHMYCIADGFETDERFEEGANFSYPADTCIYWTVNNQWKCLSGVLAKRISQSAYEALPEQEKMNGTIYYIEDGDNSMGAATVNRDGLLSAADKRKLDSVEEGATRNVTDTQLSETSENPVANRVITPVVNQIKRSLSEETERAEKIENSIQKDLETHVVDYENPHQVTKAQIGLGDVDNTPDSKKPVSTEQKKAIDAVYAQAVEYTKKAVADLVDGAPDTLNTLKEVSDALSKHEEVTEALNAAIGAKANQTDMDEHTQNRVIHITSSERTGWNDANGKKHTHDNKSVLDAITASVVSTWNGVTGKLDKSGDASNLTSTFSSSSSRENLRTGEKIAISLGKIMKWFSDLKAVAFTGSYYDLADAPTVPSVGNGTVTITQNGTTKGVFSMNQSGDTKITLTDTNTDTDTHFTTGLKVGSGPTTTVNTAAANGSVHMNVMDDKVVRDSHKITGAGATSVTSDSDGNITIRSENTTYVEASTNKMGLMSAADKTKLNGITAGANCRFVLLTQKEYNALSAPEPNVIYFIPDAD